MLLMGMEDTTSTKTPEDSVTFILADLKKRSDVLCPVMEEIYPLTNEKFLELALITLIDLGYRITRE